MWTDDDDYDCEPIITFPTDRELLEENQSPDDDPDSNDFIPLALGPPVYVGRGIRAATLDAIRTTQRGPSDRITGKTDEITKMMRRVGLDQVTDSNLSRKSTRRMPATEPVIPGLVPLINDENCFKMVFKHPREEPTMEEKAPQDDEPNSSFSSDASSVSYKTLESDSSYSSGASTISRYRSGIVGVSRHEKVYSPRELYVIKGSRRNK